MVKNRFEVNKLVWTLYTLLVVCMGFATVVEKLYGTDAASEGVYGSWWFCTLWFVLTALSVAHLVKRKVYKKLAVMLLHVAFVVILVGAFVTHLTAVSGTVHLRLGDSVNAYADKENNVRTFPFALRLTDFNIHYYPGTDAVMDYSCEVKADHEAMLISMNNIGKHMGYRFYQSAYDTDGKGTQLLVAYDPWGIAVTYCGYLLLLVSLLWTMVSKHTRIRHLYRVATRPVVLLLLLLVAMIPSAEAAKGETPTHLSPEIAHDLGKVVVLYNGRLCPLNTPATEFVTKLSGKSTWNGYTADEVFVGWMIYYTEWEEQKIIRVKNAEVQRLIGIDTQWASVRDFYTPQNEYKLKGKANDTSLSDAVRKAVRETDEKIQVITMFYNSEMLRLFPLPDGNRQNWYTPGDTNLPLGVPQAEFQFINHAMDNLVQSILVNDVEAARLMIAKIRLYQREKAGDVLPSQTRINIEVFHNTLLSARWWVFACITLSIILCVLSLGRLKEKRWLRIADGIFVGLFALYLTVLLAVRWMVSGHAPMSNGYETMIFMAWATMVLTVVLMRRIEVMKAFGPVVASLCLLVSMLASGSPQITQLMPVLQSPLLSSHVAAVMVAYSLFAIVTMISGQCLYLGRKGRVAEYRQLTALSQLLLYPAVALLAIGIFIGAVWANVSWGTYWSWDPKETWALITMMIYAIPFHINTSTPARQRLYHVFLLMAFLTVLMTYFGVNYLLAGMHSYA